MGQSDDAGELLRVRELVHEVIELSRDLLVIELLRGSKLGGTNDRLEGTAHNIMRTVRLNDVTDPVPLIHVLTARDHGERRVGRDFHLHESKASGRMEELEQ